MASNNILSFAEAVTQAEVEADFRTDPHGAAEARLCRWLVQYALLDSFSIITSAGREYPFPRARAILPNVDPRGIEEPLQNTAFAILIDGPLPRPLNKHIRLRGANRLSWRNLQRLAPDQDWTDFKAADARIDSAHAERLLRRLFAMDYALVIERPQDDDSLLTPSLSHLHVKIERLTDNALRDLGKQLGYIERRLMERGEDYVEALEARYFEYYGFPANASGRKSAAAMAAQLLSRHELRFTVFVASQEDGRLTLLRQGGRVRQILLVRLGGAEWEAFVESCDGRADPEAYEVAEDDRGSVVLYQVDYRHAAPARPAETPRRSAGVNAPWLEIAAEHILPPPGTEAPAIAFPWAEAGDF